MDDTEPSTPEYQASQDSSSDEVSSAATAELSDELSALELQTEDGWYEAEITQIGPTDADEQIVITVMLAAGKTLTWTFDKPNEWTDEYLFVSLTEQYGYGADAVDLLEGEILHIRPETDETGETSPADALLDTTGTWELRDPTQSDPQQSRDRQTNPISDFIVGLVGMSILATPIMAIALYLLPDGIGEEVIYGGVILFVLLGSIGFTFRSDSPLSSPATAPESSSTAAAPESSSTAAAPESSSSEEQSSETASELADELYALELQTDDGWFEAEVTEIEPSEEGAQISMTVMLATGKTLIWNLEKPTVWTAEYLFVRLAEQYDYGAGAVDLLEGEILHIRPDTGASDAILDSTDAWEIRDPGQSKSLSDRVHAIADSVFMVLLGIILFGIIVAPLMAILLYILPGGTGEQVVYWGGILVVIIASIALALVPDSESAD